MQVSGCEIVGSIDGKEIGEFVCQESEICTDQEVYVTQKAQSGNARVFTIEVRFENKSTTPVYLRRCRPDSPAPIYSFLLLDNDDEWGSAYNSAWACVGHSNHILVPAGAFRIDSIHVRGPNAFQNNQILGVLSGKHQIVFETVPCCGAEGRNISSNIFNVE
ncbi:MAG: hypothetical protein AB8G77_01385 [Rhodothermales bacterium]